MNKDLIRADLNNMAEVMDRTVGRSDIWLDRYIYWMAKAIRDILLALMKEGTNETD